MTWVERIDLIFPYVVLAYGWGVTFVLSFTGLMERAERSFPDSVVRQLKANRVLALICLVVGSFWSLQNLWL